MFELWTDHLIDVFARFDDAISCAAQLRLGLYEYWIKATHPLASS